MRKYFAGICLFLSVLSFVSCQKELSLDNPNSPVGPAGDSLLLVKTLKSINYDNTDAFLWQERQVFTYDKALNRTVVDLIDSGNIVPSDKPYTETFQYDAQNRLSQFTSTSTYNPAVQIDFTYNTNGDIIKTSMQDRWVGKTIECFFTNTVQSGQKTITMYDSSGSSNNGSDERPEITKYTFDAGSRLINQALYSTAYVYPQNHYADTLETKLFYDNNNFIYKVTDKFVYHPNGTDPFTSLDSALYAGEGSNMELQNSFFYIYRNMYWLDISEYSSGFANSINKGDLLPYTGSPVKTAEYWTFYPPDPAAQDHQQGLFQNTFDANGLLVKSVYPKNFGNKYGGKTEVFYTYTKIKK